MQALEEADFVIEAVSENEKIKQSIFAQLSKVWHGLLPMAAHMRSLFTRSVSSGSLIAFVVAFSQVKFCCR